MHPDYKDIRELAGDMEPEWYGDNGVPRYKPFDPDMLGVYDKFALLVELGCQGCDDAIPVGRGWPAYSFWPEPHMLSLSELATHFSYGDPPRHDCRGAGETMGSYPIRIVEAWEKMSWDWVRKPEFEGAIDDSHEWTMR